MCTELIVLDGRPLLCINDVEAQDWGVRFVQDDLLDPSESITDESVRSFCFCGVNLSQALSRAGVAFTERDGFIYLETGSEDCCRCQECKVCRPSALARLDGSVTDDPASAGVDG